MGKRVQQQSAATDKCENEAYYNVDGQHQHQLWFSVAPGGTTRTRCHRSNLDGVFSHGSSPNYESAVTPAHGKSSMPFIFTNTRTTNPSRKKHESFHDPCRSNHTRKVGQLQGKRERCGEKHVGWTASVGTSALLQAAVFDSVTEFPADTRFERCVGAMRNIRQRFTQCTHCFHVNIISEHRRGLRPCG